MADYIINTKVKIDTTSLQQSINKVNKQLKDINDVQIKTSFDTSGEAMQKMKSSATVLGAGFANIGTKISGVTKSITQMNSKFVQGGKTLYEPFIKLSTLVADIAISMRELGTIASLAHKVPLNDEFMRLHKQIQEISADVFKLQQALEKSPSSNGLSQQLKQRQQDLKLLQEQMNFIEGAGGYKNNGAVYGTAKEIINTDVEKGLSQIEQGLKGESKALKNVGDSAKSATPKVSKLTSGLGSLVKTMAPILALTKAFDVLKDSITTASDVAEATNISDTMFGKGKLNSFVDDLGERFNVAQKEGHQFTGTMASMLQSMNVPTQQMGIMSKNLTKLSGDLSSFYNISGDVAFNKLRSGMSGMAMAMKQLGINMNIAQLDEWLKSKGFNVQYKNLDMASKELVRYNYIMEKTRHIQGDYSKTSGTWANQVRALSLEWQKFKQIIGAGLIAALTPVLKLINALLSGLNKLGQSIAKALNLNIQNPTGQSGGMVQEMDDIGDAAETNQEKVKKFEKQLLGFDKINNLTTNKNDIGVNGQQSINMPVADYNKVNKPLRDTLNILKKIKPLLDSFRKGFKIGFGDGDKIFKDLIKHAKELKNVIGKIFDRGVMSSFKQMLKDIAFGFGEILGACSRIALVLADSIVNGALQALKVRVRDLQKFFKTLFKDIGDIWKSWGSIFVSLADIIEKQRPYLTKVFKGTFGIILDVFTTITHTVVGTAKELISGIARIFRNNKEGIAKAWSSILSPISTAFDDMSKITQHAAKKIIEVFDEYIRPQIRAVFDFFNKCIEGFLEGWNSVGSALKHVIPVEEIKEAIDNLFDSEEWEYMSSLIKEVFATLEPIFKEIFRIYGALLKSGFIGVLEKVAEVLKFIFSVVSNVFKIITSIFKTVQGLFQWISSGFKETSLLANGLKGIFNGVFGLIKTMFGSTFTRLGTFFKTVGNGLSGFGSRVGKVLGSFGSGMSNVAKSIGNFFSTIGKYIGQLINSAGKIGIAIGNGIINGVKSAFNTISRWLENIADWVADKLPSGGGESHGSGGSIPRLASGGVVSRSTIANIGERGKEAVVPLNNNFYNSLASAITKSMGANGIQGSGNVTVNCDFNANKFLDFSVQQQARRSAAAGVL